VEVVSTEAENALSSPVDGALIATQDREKIKSMDAIDVAMEFITAAACFTNPLVGTKYGPNEAEWQQQYEDYQAYMARLPGEEFDQLCDKIAKEKGNCENDKKKFVAMLSKIGPVIEHKPQPTKEDYDKITNEHQ